MPSENPHLHFTATLVQPNQSTTSVSSKTTVTSRQPSIMENVVSKPASAAPKFAFSQLPVELQHTIWKYSAEARASDYVSHLTLWTVNEKGVFLVRICHYVKDINGKNKLACPGRCRYVLELPALLSTCVASRDSVYDALLSFDYRGLELYGTGGLESYGNMAPRGEDIHLFLRNDVGFPHPNP